VAYSTSFNLGVSVVGVCLSASILCGYPVV
jgi:hypothetical protein